MINTPEVDVEVLFPNKPPPVVLLDAPNNPVPEDVVVAAVVDDEPNENPVEAELVAAGFAAPNNPPVLFVVFVVLDCPNVNVMALNYFHIDR